ncbi:sensor histidine kinase, partial [Staphylococcus epidermidis]|nr:sensor histidine kinase [Staphylococcus epidermidis]
MNNFRWFWFFIKSRINWILWILFLNIILLGVAYIDYEISVE